MTCAVYSSTWWESTSLSDLWYRHWGGLSSYRNSSGMSC